MRKINLVIVMQMVLEFPQIIILPQVGIKKLLNKAMMVLKIIWGFVISRERAWQKTMNWQRNG